jgi:hypothetical protein
MRYRVRNAEGEIEFQSFGQLEQAWLMGLVEPSDEVLEEGKSLWRRADTIPLLARARRHGDGVWGGAWFLWTLIGVFGGTAALWLFHQKNYVTALLISFFVAGLMIKVTVDAQRRRNPHQQSRRE